MHRLRAVIGQNLPRQRGQRTAGFVHQKVGRRKVPVVAVAACKSDVERALRDACKAQRERADPWHRHNLRVNSVSQVRNRFGPDALAPVKINAGNGRDRAPLTVAPCPAIARKNSAVAGANNAANTGRPSTASAAETAQSSRPARYERVPSIGSTIQTARALSRAGSSSVSSESQPIHLRCRSRCRSAVRATTSRPRDRPRRRPRTSLRPLLDRSAE